MPKTTKNDIEMFKIKIRDEKITKIVVKLVDMIKYALIFLFVFLSIKTIAG